MASAKSSATLLTAVACVAVLTFSAVLFYVASLDKEMQKLRGEVDALHSVCISLQTSLSARGKNTEKPHYTRDDDDNNDGYDGDDNSDKNDDDGDDSSDWNHGKNSVNRDTNMRYRHPSFNQDREKRDLLLAKRNQDSPSERRVIRANGNRQKKERARGNKRKYKTPVALFKADVGTLNPQEIFTHWRYTSWKNKPMEDKFRLGSSQKDLGKVTIMKSGLYYIFAQITFSGLSGQEFAIMKENVSGYKEEEISCCINVPKHPEAGQQSYILKTCHTSSLVLLEKGDKVFVKNKMQGTAVHFEPRYTFFGMFKLR